MDRVAQACQEATEDRLDTIGRSKGDRTVSVDVLPQALSGPLAATNELTTPHPRCSGPSRAHALPVESDLPRCRSYCCHPADEGIPTIRRRGTGTMSAWLEVPTNPVETRRRSGKRPRSNPMMAPRTGRSLNRLRGVACTLVLVADSRRGPWGRMWTCSPRHRVSLSRGPADVLLVSASLGRATPPGWMWCQAGRARSLRDHLGPGETSGGWSDRCLLA
jgi:hypothetical protein